MKWMGRRIDIFGSKNFSNFQTVLSEFLFFDEFSDLKGFWDTDTDVSDLFLQRILRQTDTFFFVGAGFLLIFIGADYITQWITFSISKFKK